MYVADLDDDNPARQFRLGFDLNGRLLELVVLRFDSGNELLIHARRPDLSTSISCNRSLFTERDAVKSTCSPVRRRHHHQR